jgi:hypothetical protein
MKLSHPGLLTFACAAISSLSILVSTASAGKGDSIVLDGDRVQVVHSASCDADTTSLNLTFSDFGEDSECDSGNDAIATGVEVALLGESCADYYQQCYCDDYCPDISTFPFNYYVNPFNSHTVAATTYGTFFGLNPVEEGPGTVSANIVALPTSSCACGQWNLNIEAGGLDLSSITSNPISLWLNDADGDGPVCFDISNAIIGAAIPVAPARHGVRREVRR